MDKRFEELKSELFNWGTDYIEEFLGFEIDSDWEKDTIDNAMNEVYEQMPEEELEVFYQKFNIAQKTNFISRKVENIMGILFDTYKEIDKELYEETREQIRNGELTEEEADFRYAMVRDELLESLLD